MQSGDEKLTFWRKVGFGLGDMYGGGSGIIISFYYLYFLTDIVRINAALAGVVILISKCTMRSPTRWKASSPTAPAPGWAGAGLICWPAYRWCSSRSSCCFTRSTWPAKPARFLFVIATYLFFSTVVSLVMVSYNALASELSLDYHERTSISSFRIFFSTFSSILCAVLPLEIVKLFPDVHQGYIAMALIFGLLFALPFIVTFFSVRERSPSKRKCSHSPGAPHSSSRSRCAPLWWCC